MDFHDTGAGSGGHLFALHALRSTIKEEVLKQRECGAQDVQRLLSDIVERLGVACKVRNAVYSFSNAARARHECPATIRHCTTNNAHGTLMRQEGKCATERGSSYLRRGQLRWLEQPRDAAACACQWRDRDKISTVDRAKRHWEESICEELNILASEQQRPLVRRGGGAGSARMKKGGRRSACAPPVRFLFDTEDLLDAITSVSTPNFALANADGGGPLKPGVGDVARLGGWGMIKVQLKTPSLAELRHTFALLHPRHHQMGVDEYTAVLLDSHAAPGEVKISGASGSASDSKVAWSMGSVAGGRAELGREDAYTTARVALGKKVAATGYVPAIRQFCKQGCPPSQRAMLWRSCLGVRRSEKERSYFQHLQVQVESWELLTDDLYKLDVMNTADHDAFFVFAEMLNNMLMAFSRPVFTPRNLRRRRSALLVLCFPMDVGPRRFSFEPFVFCAVGMAIDVFVCLFGFIIIQGSICEDECHGPCTCAVCWQQHWRATWLLFCAALRRAALSWPRDLRCADMLFVDVGIGMLPFVSEHVESLLVQTKLRAVRSVHAVIPLPSFRKSCSAV